jgi:cellulose synthase/poly-beta-1,6-N-acetylglucosamine synthase-like glycosyltransferase
MSQISPLEITPISERGFRYRFFEALPGLISWSLLVLPFAVAWFNPVLAASILISYTFFWLLRAINMCVRVVQGYNTSERYKKTDWHKLFLDLNNPEAALNKQYAGLDETVQSHHSRNLYRMVHSPSLPSYEPKELYHAIIMATYNEARDVLEPSIQNLLESNFPMDRVIFILAYEERGGESTRKTAHDLVEQYGGNFAHAAAIMHPDKYAPEEIKGKGSNITHAGHYLEEYLNKAGIPLEQVVVTTLDADHNCDKQYLANLAYAFYSCPEPHNTTFQPIPMFLNNIWDAPAPMRVIATGNSFWMVINSMRPHLLRNFAAHAQSMRAIVDSDFWSVRTIVEDGHQYWRTYFAYNGHHMVVPIFCPIYQDAVLGKSYKATLKAQFIQLRRWAWGASDIAYLIDQGFFRGRKGLSKRDLLVKIGRLLETHVSWAISSVVLMIGGFIPQIVGKEDIVTYRLPMVMSLTQMLASGGILLTLFISLKMLPPRPEKYTKRRNLWMIAQWAYLPVVGIIYGSGSALYSQTRLMLGKYLGKFDVTEKARKS